MLSDILYSCYFTHASCYLYFLAANHLFVQVKIAGKRISPIEAEFRTASDCSDVPSPNNFTSSTPCTKCIQINKNKLNNKFSVTDIMQLGINICMGIATLQVL